MVPHLKALCDAVGVLLTLCWNKPMIHDRSLDFNCKPSTCCKTKNLAGELSSALVQSISDGIVVTNSELTVCLMNNGALRLFGLSHMEQVKGHEFPSMVVYWYDPF